MDHHPDDRRVPGSVFVEEDGESWRLVASTRSLTEAFPALMGFTSVVGSLGFGVWIGMSQPIPPMDLWSLMTVAFFLALFLAFLLVFVCLGAMRLGGRIEITIQGDRGIVFTGVGGFGRTQHFDWSEVSEVQDQYMTARGVEYHEIVIHAPKKIRTGKFLTYKQSHEMLRVLRQLLARKEQRHDPSFGKQSSQ